MSSKFFYNQRESAFTGHRREAIGSTQARLTVSSTAVSLADLDYDMHADCDWVTLQVETQGVRIAWDGAVPSATLGDLVTANIHVLAPIAVREAAKLELIRSGSTDAVINVCQWKSY